jgi:hypothetical protein
MSNEEKTTEVELNKLKARSLESRRSGYKSMHRGTAQSKGVLSDFLAAETLTQMRVVLWGKKKKNKRKTK